MTQDSSHQLVFDSFSEESTEDGGMAVTLELHGESEDVYVRIISWDEQPYPAHEILAPFRRDPDNLRVTLEIVHPPITAPAEDLDDEALGKARAQAVRAIADLHIALLEARDPRRDAPEVSLSLAEVELAAGERRLEEIDAEIAKRR